MRAPTTAEIFTALREALDACNEHKAALRAWRDGLKADEVK
ncbi:hypothetical protein [Parvularcula sp. LCG005]|nr:hypothetical protein [Parvularcula sp. LCG005]WOI54288.1 hypothetical protein RUI03_04630 [Parvularcula sp. LCG005]